MSNEINNSFGGIKVNDQDKVNINFICPQCNLLLLIPTQLLCCGTRLCKWCLNKGLSDSEPFICPFCKSNQPKREIVSDRGCEREMNFINVRCHSCSWNGSYKDYKEHLEHHHADFECSDCHERFYAKNLFEEHRQEMCQYRCIPCGIPGCAESIKLCDMEAHYANEFHIKQILQIITNLLRIHKCLSTDSKYEKMILNMTNNGTKDASVVHQNICEILSAIDSLTKNNDQPMPEDHHKTKIAESSFDQGDGARILKNDCIITFCCVNNEVTMNSSFSIPSPKFKTAPYGYLFALRVGSTISNSNSEQGFLSIFISLCRGNYDAILTFPFPYDIYVCLYDQTGQKKHIISKIESNRHALELARQTSEKNNEIGIIEFCRLNQLTKEESIYLKANVFYIGIFIDFMKTQSHPFNR